MLIFDEAHFAFPQRYSATTTPFRLNYIRSQILEAGNPVALINTPQFLDAPRARTSQCGRVRSVGRGLQPARLGHHFTRALPTHSRPPHVGRSDRPRVGSSLDDIDPFEIVEARLQRLRTAVARPNFQDSAAISNCSFWRGPGLSEVLLTVHFRETREMRALPFTPKFGKSEGQNRDKSPDTLHK